MSAASPWWKTLGCWLARIIAGGAFVASGWAKAVDPQGFVLKLHEYLAAWHIDGAVPTDLLALAAVGLALFELTTGVLLMTGSLRRTSAIAGLALMAVMLPLTVYIAIADPVQDCGCFGDMIVFSNTATLVKNIILTALLVIALVWYKSARCLYRAGLQWLVITLTVIYGVIVATIGWQIQPMVDFRPYGVGKPLVSEQESDDVRYIYERDGEQASFSLDNLPDSTWTFVGADQAAGATDAIAVFDGDEEVTDEVLGPDATDGDMLILVVTEPGVDNLVRSRLANDLADYASAHDIRMIGLVAADGAALDDWRSIVGPHFDTYSADQVSLRQLVRGKQGLVYLHDGRVVWKRNFATLPPDLLDADEPLSQVTAVDDGRVALWLSGFYVSGMLLLLAISALTQINLRPYRKKKNGNSNTTNLTKRTKRAASAE